MVNYYVSPTGNNSNDGLSTSSPKLTIDNAHTAASNGDTIILMDGTHSYSADLSITKNVSLTSLNGAASTILSFTVTDKTITFQDVSGSVISNITINDTGVNSAVLNITFPSSGATKPTVWPTNVTVRNCVFNTKKYAIATKGENISIYNNTINSIGTDTITPILVYFVRGFLFIDGNTWTDNTNPRRFVYLGGFGTAGSSYLNFVNSRNGAITLSNNKINMDTTLGATPSSNRTMIFMNQDQWNNRAATEAGDGLTLTDVTTMRISWNVTGNVINANSSGGTLGDRLRTRGMIAFTTANDSNGENFIKQWSSAYITNNQFNCTGTAANAEGMMKIDSSTFALTITDFTTPKFYMDNNTITQPSPFVPRTDNFGDANFIQTLNVRRTDNPIAVPVIYTYGDLNTQAWIVTSFSNPAYSITSDNLFYVPGDIDVTLTGSYASYSSLSENKIGTSVTLPITGSVITQIAISNLGTDVYKVIAGTSSSIVSNSFWFFVRVYDINGNIITTFANPISIEITLDYSFGTNTLQVLLDGTTERTSATYDPDTNKVTFTLSSNSEYLLQNQLPCLVEGTKVLTSAGYVNVEKLASGDMIVTGDKRIVQVMKVYSTTYDRTNKNTAPYTIEKEAFGQNCPPYDLRVSGRHAIQIKSGFWEIPAEAAKENPKVYQERVGNSVSYYHVVLPDYTKDTMVANGQIVESLNKSKYVESYVWNSTHNGYERKLTYVGSKKSAIN
jgi:hypothetical protein